MKTYSQFDVVAVPFPFTDTPKTKKRPALVLSENKESEFQNGYSVCAMITSQKNSPWPLDIIIKNIEKTGLPVASKVRMKIFTIDTKLIEKKIGVLDGEDIKNTKDNLRKLFALK
jgi:mRNA interferase MazF